MPQIEVSDKNFRRLQSLAQPLIDTVNTVIDRLIDSYERSNAITDVARPQKVTVPMTEFDPASPPPLTHTKLRSAMFGGIEIDRPKWADVVRTALEVGIGRLGFDNLRTSTDANIVKGKKTSDGYSYLPKLDVSVQGEDAQDCWRIAFDLAKKINVPLNVSFEWRDKEGAANPGQMGKLTWWP